MRNISKYFLMIGFLIISSLSYAGMGTLSDNYDVQVFIKSMASKYNFDASNLTELFRYVTVQKNILNMMKQPKESNPWFRYRSFFITQKRVDDGVIFWNKNAKTLAYAQEKYGVPADIIVSIIGVETHYGTNMGKYRVIDALSTLAFFYPQRSAFFKGELAQFLLLTREQNLNPLMILGSYAGAMGAPQFMPSSFRRLAVSSNGNKKIDLWKNPNDAIISVANYFKNYGWQYGQPVATLANINNRYARLSNKKLQPVYTLQQLNNHGVRCAQNFSPNLKANLIALQGPNQQQYWIGFNNFYVITKYNTSINYAMAVYQLGQTIEAVRDRELKIASNANNKVASNTNKPIPNRT